MNNLKYIHYSEHKFKLKDRNYQSIIDFKPDGFWLSCELPDGDEGVNWYDWCISEGFEIHRLRHIYEVSIKPDNQILYLTTPDEVLKFSKRYSSGIHLQVTNRTYKDRINWEPIHEKYDGVVICPYFWTLRTNLECIWYNSWDCSSGCIWNLSIIEDIKLIQRKGKKDE